MYFFFFFAMASIQQLKEAFYGMKGHFAHKKNKITQNGLTFKFIYLLYFDCPYHRGSVVR